MGPLLPLEEPAPRRDSGTWHAWRRGAGVRRAGSRPLVTEDEDEDLESQNDRPAPWMIDAELPAPSGGSR